MKTELYNGDCLEYLKRIPDGGIDLVVTDIPYDGVNRESNGLRNLDKGKADICLFSIQDLMSGLIRVSKGSGYIFCAWWQISEIVEIIRNVKLSCRLCVWEKTNPSPMNGDKIWLSGLEFCVFWKKPNAVFNAFCKNPVWRYQSGTNELHPTQKPIPLFERLIVSSSNPSDTVFDPFMGSGTTGVACKNLNRNFIGCELDPEYFKIAEDRIKNTQEPMF